MSKVVVYVIVTLFVVIISFIMSLLTPNCDLKIVIHNCPKRSSIPQNCRKLHYELHYEYH